MRFFLLRCKEKKITRSTVRKFNYIKPNAVKVLPSALAYQKQVYTYFFKHLKVYCDLLCCTGVIKKWTSKQLFCKNVIAMKFEQILMYVIRINSH